jgi:hypothetical protein
MPGDLRHSPHHRHVIEPDPKHAAVGRPGVNRVLQKVRHLRVAQLAQVNHPRFMRIQSQLRQGIMHAVGRNEKPHARRLVAFVGEKQDRLRVFVQVLGIGP